MRRASSSAKPISEILKTTLRVKGLDQKIQKYSFVENWHQIVGKDIADHSRPDKIQGGAFYIRVQSSSWAQELTFFKDLIIKRLTEHLNLTDPLNGDRKISDLRFIVDSRAF